MTSDRFLYSLASPIYYDTLDRYKAETSHYTNFIAKILPREWSIQRRDIWTNCLPATVNHPAHGWKIHISSCLADAPAVLAASASIFIKFDTPFKYCADGFILRLQSSKRWPRGKSGKFITAYPADEGTFKDLMSILYDQLQGYSGPYILSDKRYRDCQVLYYRYGGMTLATSLLSSGERIPVLVGPQGQVHYDLRHPYQQEPEWVVDPFDNNVDASVNDAMTLRDGRYQVLEALSFSNSGGVYKAVDRRTGDEVIIKEARPHTNIQRNGRDALSLLKKEHRLLTLLEPLSVAPRPLDFFCEWEHAYLVQQFIHGSVLRFRSSEISIVIRTNPSKSEIEAFLERYVRVYSNIAVAFAKIHEYGVVFTDVSHYNVLVDDDSDGITLIDFEGAYQLGIDNPTSLFTPGFAPASALSGSSPTQRDDCYGLGGLLLAGLMPINALSNVKAHPEQTFVPHIIRDFCLPQELGDLILNLLSDNSESRYSAREVVEKLHNCKDLQSQQTTLTVSLDIPGLLNRISSGIWASADYTRTDRLFPADSAVFNTNPLQLESGACGVVAALRVIDGNVTREPIDWIEAQLDHPGTYPPGLYSGLAGIAWTLKDLGEHETAFRMADAALGHPLLYDAPGLFYGSAGVGMTALSFALDFNDRRFMNAAITIAENLVQEAGHDADTLFWATGDKVYYGMGSGGSGISLFFLYLSVATGIDKYFDLGKRAIAYELRNSITTVNNGLSWRIHKDHPTHSPYFKYGSSGVGMALLRYSHYLGDTTYDEPLDSVIREADRKYAIFPGRMFGLAGIGEFCMDLYYFRKEARFLAMAERIAEGISLFSVDTENGVLFPGEELLRLSADLGTGATGIALFLNRLHRRDDPQLFMLDELLLRRSQASTGKRSDLLAK